MHKGPVAFWLFQALFLCTFMFFSQFFWICFGPAGSLFNIISLSLQLVSSGAMVPRELLNSFYSGIGQYLPATYAVQGILSIQSEGQEFSLCGPIVHCTVRLRCVVTGRDVVEKNNACQLWLQALLKQTTNTADILIAS